MMIVSTSSEYDYNTLKDDLKIMLCEYPFLQKINIGKSVLGKDIFCLRFGKGGKKIFINAAHHGNEWITSMLCMAMLEKLCYAYKNGISLGMADIKKLFEKTSLYVCPMVNPDGVNLSVSGIKEDFPPIIKQRLISYNGGSNDFIGKWQANINGVDLNHNYDAGFKKGKVLEAQEKIFSPGPTRFSGHFPFSEPETCGIKDFTLALSPHICVAYHSQGEEIYYDYNSLSSDYAKSLAFAMAEISGYKASSPKGMASFSGFKDWVIEKLSIPAYTIEVGLGKNPLPLNQFDSIFQKNLPMLLFLMNK